MANNVVAEQRTRIKFYGKSGKSITGVKKDLQKVYGETALA